MLGGYFGETYFDDVHELTIGLPAEAFRVSPEYRAFILVTEGRDFRVSLDVPAHRKLSPEEDRSFRTPYRAKGHKAEVEKNE